MGLSGPRKRTKISHDPNNTTWTRSANTFGHKILTSQGWSPGDFLGAKAGSHAKHYTIANASHIRVVLKDDNLGLGAKRGSGQVEGQCTGLDAFQGLLGRLNGKGESELQKEQHSRNDLKRAIYTERRWGSVRFVSGGLLVGEKIQTLDDSQAASLPLVPKQGAPTARATSLTSREIRGQDGTRKLGAEPDLKAAGETNTRKKKRKWSRSQGEMNNVGGAEVEVVQRNTQLKMPAPSLTNSTAPLSSPMLTEALTSGENGAQGTEAKTEKKRLKAERRAIEDAKRKRRVGRETTSTTMACTDLSERNGLVQDDAKVLNIADQSQSDSNNMAPTLSSAVMVSGGRHAVRRRYIQQKKLAVIDMKALNEILMVKSRPHPVISDDAGR